MKGRKSNKNLINTYNNQVWKIGIYCRLSSDDGESVESDSIKNQREMLEYHLKKEENSRIIDYYSDDGFSGTSFNRPDFKRMFNDVISGKINTIVVKDLSRFGRNYIEVGNYIEQIFPIYNVRFIAINDGIDSHKDPKSINNVIVPFKNLMNDEYARDISNKVKNAYYTMSKNGKFVGGTPPYGYQKSSSNKHQLIINNQEAKIVKLIFEKAVSNNGRIRICKYLNENKILCRKELQRRIKRNISLDSLTEECVYRWSTSTIEKILSNETYIGNLVFGRTGNLSYKVHKTIYKPKEDWIIVSNTHEAIIDKKIFEKVQEKIKERTKERKETTNMSIYKGKIKCANCGRAMSKMDDFRRKNPSSNYYCMSKTIFDINCKTHKIKTSILDNIVLQTILLQVKMVINIEKALNDFKKLSSNNTLEREYKNKINKFINDINKYKNIKKRLYEDWKFEKITKEEFVNYSKDYDKNIDRLNGDIKALEIIYLENIKNLKKEDYWIDHFKRNKKIKLLTKDIIDELIEKILVHNDGNITIIFKYQDEYRQALDLIASKEGNLNETVECSSLFKGI